MNKVNRLVLCRDKYKDDAEFWNVVSDATKLLLNADYIFTMRWDEKGLGILCIDYNHADTSYGEIHPYWLTYEQAESL